MLNTNKKAVSEWDSIWIGVIVGIIVFFVSIISGMKSMPNYIGEYQFSIIESAYNAENGLLYAYTSAKYASSQSVHDLARNGGSYKNEKCGSYFGYSFWLAEGKNTEECFADYKSSFKLILNENMDTYLKNYPDADMPLNNYNVELNGNSITGLASSDLKIPINAVGPDKKSIITGAYSINPSFNIDIGYDFDDYIELKEISNTVVQCLKENDAGICLNIAEGINGKFDWEAGCDKGAEKVLYDFAEFYQDCMDSEDSNCLCKKNLELSKEQVESFGVAGEHHLNLRQDANNRKVIINAKDTDLSYGIDFNDVLGLFPERYILSYTKDGSYALNMLFINDLSGEELGSLGPLKEITIYKYGKDGRKYADFVKEDREELLYPVSERNIKKPEGLHECSSNPKNIYKLCATKKDFKLNAYTKTDSAVKPRDVVYKFALYAPKESKTE